MRIWRGRCFAYRCYTYGYCAAVLARAGIVRAGIAPVAALRVATAFADPSCRLPILFVQRLRLRMPVLHGAGWRCCTAVAGGQKYPQTALPVLRKKEIVKNSGTGSFRSQQFILQLSAHPAAIGLFRSQRFISLLSAHSVVSGSFHNCWLILWYRADGGFSSQGQRKGMTLPVLSSADCFKLRLAHSGLLQVAARAQRNASGAGLLCFLYLLDHLHDSNALFQRDGEGDALADRTVKGHPDAVDAGEVGR